MRRGGSFLSPQDVPVLTFDALSKAFLIISKTTISRLIYVVLRQVVQSQFSLEVDEEAKFGDPSCPSQQLGP